MKYVLACLFVLLLVPPVSALTLNLSASYSQGQTVLSEVQGYIAQPIAKQNVALWRRNVQVAFDYDFKRLGDTYYLWFVTPTASNNYSLRIANVHTLVNGQEQTITVETNFTVDNTSAPYYFKPAFVETNDSFTLMFFSSQDSSQQVPIGQPYAQNILVHPGDNSIDLDVTPLGPGLNRITLGYTDFLVYNTATSPITGVYELVRVMPTHISTILMPGNQYMFPVHIINTGPHIREVTLDINESLFTVRGMPSKIDSNESVEFNITYKGRRAINQPIFLHLDNQTIELAISINYTENQTIPLPNGSTVTGGTQGYFCRELDGKLCQGTEVCQGALTTTRDGECCLSTCQAPATTSYSWIGYLLGALIIIVLGFVTFKYYRAKKVGGAIPPLVKKV